MKKNITAFIVTVVVVMAIIFMPYYLTIGLDNLLGLKHEDYALLSWFCGWAIVFAAAFFFVVLLVIYDFIYESIYD